MLEQIDALWAAVRQLQSDVKPLLPEPPPPPVPTEDDPERAKRLHDEAVAEVTNQEERAKANIEAAKAHAQRAKEILDKSTAAARAQEQAAQRAAQHPEQPEPRTPPQRK